MHHLETHSEHSDTLEVGVWGVKKCVKFSNFLLFYLKALKTVVKLVFNLFQNTVCSLNKDKK